jgi:hypothetical protein
MSKFDVKIGYNALTYVWRALKDALELLHPSLRAGLAEDANLIQR